MSKNNAIDIFLRVRPTKQAFGGFSLDKENNKVQFVIKNKEEDYINNNKESRIFAFNSLFDMDATQEKIFDKIARDVVQSAFDGFNGTLFAYGQTGSGKTFTMSGGAVSYDDRGIIPRTLTHVFNSSRTRGVQVKVAVSYMQIYNNAGYDLLSEGGTSKLLSSLRKVHPFEEANGQLQLEGLEKLPVENEEEAMTQLLRGEDTRAVCRTPKNDESTRSHCIFSIYLETSKVGTDIKSVATIRLVDLSGSERIKQTGVEGKLQKEAIGINLGLHYLERVIVALNDKAKGINVHVPYRDSFMTTVLKDSIGGNCMTRMVATISAKEEDIPQSIETCRFAMRVALIKNSVCKNEAVDVGIIIARLKTQNAQLKAELALLKGDNFKEQLDKYDIDDCHKLVEDFVSSDDPNVTIVLNDRLKINQCFHFFKTMISKGGNNKSTIQKSEVLHNKQPQQDHSSEQLRRLKLIIQQKDNEIAMLVTAIKDRRGPILMLGEQKKEEQSMIRSIVGAKPILFKQHPQQQHQQLVQSSMGSTREQSLLNNGLSNDEVQKMLTQPVNLTAEDMLDEARALDKFRKSYRKRQVMEKNAAQLQQRLVRGKELGKIVTDMRREMEQLKDRLQRIKRENAVQSLVEGREQEDAREEEIRDKILELKEKSKPYTDQLRETKAAYESLTIMQKKLNQQLSKDFQNWMMHFAKRRQAQVKEIDASLLASSVRDQEVSKNLASFFKAQEQIKKR